MRPARFLSLIQKKRHLIKISGLAALLSVSLIANFSQFYLWTDVHNRLLATTGTVDSLETKLTQTQEALTKLENEDQNVRNDALQKRQDTIEDTYRRTVAAYERLLDLQGKGVKTEAMADQLATVLAQLAKSDFEAANENLTKLTQLITEAENQLRQEAALAIPAATVTSSEPPAGGYSRQRVETQIGAYVVSLVAGDLSSTRITVDTASGSDCGNDCPVLPLADYVARNGGYAGINGTYFCPASYPTCAGKTNTFDLLVMNKDKVYFNSDNNVYSNNPGVIFGGGYIRFVSAVSQWGRDTGIDGMLSNYPLLLSGGEIRFTGNEDPKIGSKGNRSFVANKGNTVYIGVVHGATVAEAAWALKGLGMENALNLDDGGSTALWASGYKVGPGRNIPNAIVFVRK